MDLLERDVSRIDRLAARFELSTENFCLMIGVCNPSESELKKAIEDRLKNNMQESGFTVVSISPEHFSQDFNFSNESKPGEIYWLDLVITEERAILAKIEQYREVLTGKAASVFILTGFEGFKHLKEKAPNFFNLAYPKFFGIETFIEELRDELKGKFAEIIKNSKEFENKIERYLKRKRCPETNYFLNLRQWNSYTPILNFRKGDPRGGGYYIKWDDTGIVVDPGHGFIQNLFECGLGIDDIDVIAITHDHPDHTQEFPLLIDLLYQFNKRKPGGAIPKRFSFLLNASSFSKFAPIIRYETTPNLCQILWKDKEIRLGKTNGITIKPTLTRHKELGGSEMGVGLLFNLFDDTAEEQCSIGITGDTAWTPFLVDAFNRTDILIAHLGTVHETEIEKREFYQKHLGILGFYNLFTQLLRQPHQPKIVILSEFGEELSKSRNSIANVFQSSIPNADNTRFLPADIGLKIRLGEYDEIHPLCSYQEKGARCGKPANIQKEIDSRIAMFCEKHGK